jgi:hypothetical protein
LLSADGRSKISDSDSGRCAVSTRRTYVTLFTRHRSLSRWCGGVRCVLDYPTFSINPHPSFLSLLALLHIRPKEYAPGSSYRPLHLTLPPCPPPRPLPPRPTPRHPVPLSLQTSPPRLPLSSLHHLQRLSTPFSHHSRPPSMPFVPSMPRTTPTSPARPLVEAPLRSGSAAAPVPPPRPRPRNA